ncbi:uncharacterized protein LOC143179547 [Calliopsis andreniformis]|uniref:uncharacterized protein LOC143179547 n=1 Tax=Calliopsis andreniformis TaxID=337506 RepID=UPI003FCC6E2F
MHEFVAEAVRWWAGEAIGGGPRPRQPSRTRVAWAGSIDRIRSSFRPRSSRGRESRCGRRVEDNETACIDLAHSGTRVSLSRSVCLLRPTRRELHALFRSHCAPQTEDSQQHARSRRSSPPFPRKVCDKRVLIASATVTIRSRMRLERWGSLARPKTQHHRTGPLTRPELGSRETTSALAKRNIGDRGLRERDTHRDAFVIVVHHHHHRWSLLVPPALYIAQKKANLENKETTVQYNTRDGETRTAQS